MAAPEAGARSHVAAAVVAAITFVAVAMLERRIGVAGWERSATRWFFELPDGVGVVLRPANELGNRLVAVAIAALTGWRHTPLAGLAVFSAAALSWASASIVKVAVGRPRISAAELGAPARDVVHDASFPSSHVAIAVAVAATVALVGTTRWRWALVPVAALTAVARLWIGVHLPLDVIGGAVVGAGFAFAVVAIAGAIDPEH